MRSRIFNAPHPTVQNAKWKLEVCRLLCSFPVSLISFGLMWFTCGKRTSLPLFRERTPECIKTHGLGLIIVQRTQINKKNIRLTKIDLQHRWQMFFVVSTTTTTTTTNQKTTRSELKNIIRPSVLGGWWRDCNYILITCKCNFILGKLFLLYFNYLVYFHSSGIVCCLNSDRCFRGISYLSIGCSESSFRIDTIY